MFAWINSRLSPAGPAARLVILIFHRVHPRPDALFPHEMDARRFEARMKVLARDWRVLPLPDALNRLFESRLPARAMSITFDDGYADNFTQAAPILKRLGLPATFFISTGFMNGEVMWNDKVVEAVRATRLPQLELTDLGLGVFDLATQAARRASIAALLPAIKYLPPATRDAMVAQLVQRARVAPARDLMMRPEQLRALSGSGHSIGAHTVTHPILSRLDVPAAREEIARSRQTLESLLQRPVDLFAYPNGKPGTDYGAEHVDILRELGFKAALTTEARLADASCNPLELPRYTPWQPSITAARAALCATLIRARWRGLYAGPGDDLSYNPRHR